MLIILILIYGAIAAAPIFGLIVALLPVAGYIAARWYLNHFT